MRNVCSLKYSLNALIWYYNISIKAELKHLNAIDIYWLYQECEFLFWHGIKEDPLSGILKILLIRKYGGNPYEHSIETFFELVTLNSGAFRWYFNRITKLSIPQINQLD